MIEFICGIIIGVVMGLTGAGGALISIPLFMQFLGHGLREASLYSLVAVVMASLLNFLAQKSSTQYRTGIIIILSSAVGSFLSTPFKKELSTFGIAIILSLVSLYALYTVWFPAKSVSPPSGDPLKSVWFSLIIGLLLGALTTFTGLGGGVLMLPIFLNLYHFSTSQAVATSLFSVGLSSLSSLLIQINQGMRFDVTWELGYLLIGILFSALLLKRISQKMKPNILERARQIVFSIVVVLAMVKIFEN